ncbi:MAG: hypothetical protein CL840_17440 [Crocinitomicaceae bacterium]|nr:hypothetical protein [Crocinitomicaceae bacterium]|tara:strand:- start:6715 stop:9468 length:2754 start_codon:yes stop_codon:yes gene_type:complete
MRILLISLFSLFTLSVIAQQLLEPNLGNNSNDYLNYVKNIESWKSGKDLSKEKGYKWIDRWANFYQSRTNGKGELVSNEYINKAAIEVALLKSMYQASRASDSTWSPEGPDTLVGSFDPASSHGVARVNCIAFHPTDTNTYWVGVSQGGIWKTSNSGKSYTPINNNLPILRISDIAIDPTDPDIIYLSVGDYAYLGVALATDGRKRNTHYGLGVYKTTDGGKTWKPTGLSYKQTDFDQSLIRRVFINPDDNQELVAAGISGVWKSKDGGDNWSQTLNEIMWDLEINSENSNSLIASSGYISNLKVGNAAIWKSTDFGDTWKKANAPIAAQNEVQRVELTISTSDTNRCYAVSCAMDRGFYGFYKSLDGGSTWDTTMTIKTGINMLTWDDGNQSGGQGTYDLFVYSDAVNPDRVFVGGINVWGSDDAGATWDGVSYWLRYYGFTPHADQHYMSYNPLDKKYYLCNDGGIFRTDSIKIGSWEDTDSVPGYQFPTKWEDVSSGMQITSLYRVGISQNNSGYLVAGAQDNGTFYRKANKKWSNINGGDGMDCFIDRNDPNHVVVSSQYGNIARTLNGGNSRAQRITPSTGENMGWTTPLLAHPTSTNFYLGGENVHQFISRWNWNQLGTLPGGTKAPISAMDISDSNETHLVVTKRVDYINKYNAQVFKTANGGTKWENITQGLPDSLYFTSVKIDDRDPKIMWVTTGGFIDGVKIFETRDGGANWKNISRNLPNIPVNCIEQDEYSGNNAVYLGTDVGVYYTNDSLSTWQLYSKDLPNVIVSDLDMHYKERRLYCSTFGRGVWSVEAIDTVFAFQADTTKKDTSETKDTTFVRELKWDNTSFKIAPNPNRGSFAIQYKTELLGEWNIQIIDVMGKTVFQQVYRIDSPAGENQLDLNLLPGSYFIRVSNQSRTKTLKFLVE